MKVILPVITAFDFTDDEQTVYQILSRTIPKSVGEITAEVPFGRSKVSTLLKSLEQKQYIVILGRGRGTKYKII